MLFRILLATFLGSIVSLCGGVLLLAIRGRVRFRLEHILSAFAAGALLATAFIDLLPEAEHHASAATNIFLWTLIGFFFFFLFERAVHWFHHHDWDDEDDTTKAGHDVHHHAPSGGLTALIIVGTAAHNFIDGVAIAASFLASTPLGITTAIAVGIHEIPKEISDFAVLLKAGMPRGRVLFVNFASACVAFVGAGLTYAAATHVTVLLPVFLAVTAGLFIYVAASDLIPETHREAHRRLIAPETIALLAGALIVGGAITLLGV